MQSEPVSPESGSGGNVATASDQSAAEAFNIVMTGVHKKTINRCYKDLVDNMSVDVIADYLISELIITLRDAEDIQQPGDTAKKAEILLDILLRKPDVAFDKLVEAFNSTEQTHLANLLVREEKSVTLKVELVDIKSTTQRPVDEVNLNQNLKDILTHKVAELKDQVLERDPAQNETLTFMERLMSLPWEILDVKVGCILLTLQCPSLEALRDLNDAVTTKTLQASFAETFFTEEWKASHGIESIGVEMTICPLEYAQCERELSTSGWSQDQSMVEGAKAALTQATAGGLKSESSAAMEGTSQSEIDDVCEKHKVPTPSALARAEPEIKESETASSPATTTNIEPELECPICRTMFEDPRTLPCGHSHCLHCLKNHALHTRMVDGKIQCPQCRQKCKVPDGNVENFPKNFALMNILAKYSKGGPLEPKVGLEIADVKQKKQEPSHFPVGLSGIEKGAAKGQNEQCEHHQHQRIDLYCSTCALPVCSECVQETHQDHNTELLSVTLMEYQRDLDTVSKMAAKRVACLKQMAGELHMQGSKIKQDVHQAKHDIIDGMYSLVKYYKKVLQVKVGEAEESVETHMTVAMKEFEHLMQKTSDLQLHAENLALPGADISTVLHASEIKKELLRQQDIPVPTVQHNVHNTRVKAAALLNDTDILGDVGIKATTCPDSRKDFKTENVSLGAPLQTIKLDYTGEWAVIGIAPIYKTMICVAHAGEEYTSIWVYSTEGQIKKNMQIPGIAKIYGMVAIDGNEGKLAIIDDTSGVQFVTLSEDLEVLQHTTKDLPVNPDRISIGCNQQLTVNNGCGNKLIVLSADGEVLSTVEATIPLDKKVNVSATQTHSGFVICDVENKTVYFTDVNGHVVHTSTDCVNPWRAVHTSWGHVLIADYTGDEVKVFSEAGEFLGNVHDNSGSISRPMYLHIDETERLLYVAHGFVGEHELRTYKFAPSDLPPLPVKRAITNLEVTVKLAKA